MTQPHAFNRRNVHEGISVISGGKNTKEDWVKVIQQDWQKIGRWWSVPSGFLQAHRHFYSMCYGPDRRVGLPGSRWDHFLHYSRLGMHSSHSIAARLTMCWQQKVSHRCNTETHISKLSCFKSTRDKERQHIKLSPSAVSRASLRSALWLCCVLCPLPVDLLCPT